MSSKLNFIKPETRKRCHIFDVDSVQEKKFQTISTELFQYLFEIKSIDFNLYFRIDQTLVEYIKPNEFSRELLEQMWKAVQVDRFRLEICIKRVEMPKFQNAIDNIRQNKISNLLEKDPHLNRNVLESFQNLSGASQLVVRGGIDNTVASKVKASAAFMVNNIMDSEEAISTLSRMVIHDPTLYDHSASVAMIAGVIGKQCLKKPLSPKECELVSQCGLYHDVGKTCIPSAVLNKPGKFTDEEFSIMKKHAELGEEELMRVIDDGAQIDTVAARVAGEHHERFCGQGYPRGKAGRSEEGKVEGIHLYSRIVTIADVYSALLMKRVYKPSYESQDAIKLMSEIAENEYDPEIFYPFLKSVVKSLNAYQKSVKGEAHGRILVIEDSGKLTENKKVS